MDPFFVGPGPILSQIWDYLSKLCGPRSRIVRLFGIGGPSVSIN